MRALRLLGALILFGCSMVLPLLNYGTFDRKFIEFVLHSGNPLHLLIFIVAFNGIAFYQLRLHIPMVNLLYEWFGWKHPAIYFPIHVAAQSISIWASYFISKRIAISLQLTDLHTASGLDFFLLFIVGFICLMYFGAESKNRNATYEK